jgi:hypothetical protein
MFNPETTVDTLNAPELQAENPGSGRQVFTPMADQDH